MSDSSHKRSKSGIARSLLQRVSSKHDIPTLNTTDESLEPSPTDSRTSTSPSTGLSPNTPLSRHSTVGHKTRMATTMSADDQNTTTGQTQDIQGGDAASTPPQGTSIEASVKLFKVFEALRSGDTTALKAATGNSADGAVDSKLDGTTVLHLAVQCAEPPVVDFVVKSADGEGNLNARDRDGNTPLHIASTLGRAHIVRLLLEQRSINDSIPNAQGKTALDLARNPDVYQQLQLARSIYTDTKMKQIHELVSKSAYDDLEALLADSRVRSTIDVNGPELATEPQTLEAGGSLLHEAARKRDIKLAQMLLLNGADPFRRDRKGKLPQDVTKDDRTRAILKRSPAAAVAQRGIQEKAILGSNAHQAAARSATGDGAIGAKEAREMKGYLKKWTNYTSGYKLRFFVLEDGVLSYYKHQDDAGSACRGAINMRIAKLHMDPKDKLGFEIHGKSSVKYHLKANHEVEAKRWYWSLNNAIQHSKDEAKGERLRERQGNEAVRQAQLEKTHTHDGDASSTLAPSSAAGVPLTSASLHGVSSNLTDGEGSTYEPSTAGDEIIRHARQGDAATAEGDMDDDDEYGDDASSHETKPANKDAFNITAQSAKLQLDLLSSVSAALQSERAQHPDLPLSHPSLENALTSYDSALNNLKALLMDLVRISRDHDAYWQYRLDREANVRKLWEDSMARVAREQEELQGKIGESEDKRRKTKRALRDALEGQTGAQGSPSRSRRPTQPPAQLEAAVANIEINDDNTAELPEPLTRRRLTIADLTNNEVSDDESDVNDEFFDAVDAGEVEVVDEMPPSSAPPTPAHVDDASRDAQEGRVAKIEKSYKGYEDGIRKRLKLDNDNRPKVSLWAVLKSMIGKDMTKMTLPVSFNEPTSLLYRVVEDMEYTDLLNTAADRTDSTERMVYVAAFAASEYASTIGRVAKPFNPLLGETYEYVRPDKGYRFFIEQVSHHPPVGAAFAESAKWDYYGESSVKSKFYGKSFEFNPLGTWFLRLRTASGTEELYTWKKVTSSVVGIITGNPTVDNYGPMQIKNWTTGEVCHLEFKPRGWKANSAFQVTGKVVDAEGKTRWSMGGRWNDKIYARLTPGYEGAVDPSMSAAGTGGKDNANQAFLVWEAHPRPTGIPFNLTPFCVTLNALPERLKPIIAPTDTRLRPDQRAMEDGEYDYAATEKTRVEEKQRAKRRKREQAGEEFVPKWFSQARDQTTGEMYWKFNGEYWNVRDRVAEGETSWEGLEDIF